jgi:hypothetical protein
MRWFNPLSRQRLVLGVMLSVLFAHTAAMAQAPSADSSANPSALTYRRVYVPADRPEEWPTAGEQFLPLDRDEFERLTAAAEESRRIASVGGAQLTSARYEASLADDGTLSGQAWYEVKVIDARSHVLELAPLNLALSDARWADDRNDAETRAAPLIGGWSKDKRDCYGVLI